MSAKEKQVKERIQISQMCRLIVYSDGTYALWSGADRVGLSSYEVARLKHALPGNGVCLVSVAEEVKSC